MIAFSGGHFKEFFPFPDVVSDQKHAAAASRADPPGVEVPGSKNRRPRLTLAAARAFSRNRPSRLNKGVAHLRQMCYKRSFKEDANAKNM